MQRTYIAAILTTLATGAAAPALAQQAAEVTLDHLAYRLVDLAPDDGIAPSLTWTSDTTLAYTHVYDQDGNEIDGRQIEALGTAGFDNGYATMQVDAQADAARVQLGLASGYGYADTNRSFHFTLSPNTQVIFSADADLWASWDQSAHSTVSALAELYGSLRGVGDGDWTFNTRAQVDQGSQHGSLTVSATSRDAWIDGYLAMNAYAVAESQALPVPEPASGAMLVGGLGLMAAFMRRRRA
jgi:hypothetical protein